MLASFHFFNPSHFFKLGRFRMNFTKIFTHLVCSVYLLVCCSVAGMAQTNELQTADSLQYKRGVFFGQTYQGKSILEKKKVRELLKENTIATKKYRFGGYLKPLGVVTSMGGIALSYLALKGKSASAVVEGKTYNYTIRSMPQLILGLSGFVGGICLMEFGHELQATSIDIYNANLHKPKVTFFKKASFGITPQGNIGLSAHF